MIFSNYIKLYHICITVEPVRHTKGPGKCVDCTGCQNLSNPTHQGTREVCRIVQDVEILRFYFSEQKYFGIIHFCRKNSGVRLHKFHCTFI